MPGAQGLRAVWGSSLSFDLSPDDEDLFNKYDVDGDQMLSKQEDGLLHGKSWVLGSVTGASG